MEENKKHDVQSEIKQIKDLTSIKMELFTLADQILKEREQHERKRIS